MATPISTPQYSWHRSRDRSSAVGNLGIFAVETYLRSIRFERKHKFYRGITGVFCRDRGPAWEIETRSGHELLASVECARFIALDCD